MTKSQPKEVSLQVNYNFRELEVKLIRRGSKDHFSELEDEIIKRLEDKEDTILKLRMKKQTVVRAAGAAGGTSAVAFVGRLLGVF